MQKIENHQEQLHSEHFSGAREPQSSATWPDGRTVSHAIVEALEDLGVRSAFGLFGRALAPFADALLRSRIQVVHTRHENGAAFAAQESYFASGSPSVVFTTTGPGLTNAITGVASARWEGAKLLLFSPATSSTRRGRGAFQETCHGALPSAFFTKNELFDYAVVPESVEELELVFRRLAAGLAQKGGFVAHICLPVTLQTAAAPQLSCPAPVRISRTTCNEAEIQRVAAKLTAGPAALWVGFGARDSAAQIVRLAELLRCPVMASPRAKGTFPEHHPQYLGVTGLGGHHNVGDVLTRLRPDHILVLGTRLGEYSSLWAPEFRPRKEFIAVDRAPTPMGRAFPTVPTHFVRSEIDEFLEPLCAALETQTQVLEPPPMSIAMAMESGEPTVEGFGQPTVSASVLPSGDSPAGTLHPSVVWAGLQRRIVDGSDAILMTEAGNSFAWGSHALFFDEPLRYRSSVGFGSMGAMATGVIGAALGRPGKAVAVLGDGSMLMQSEVSTAVSHRIPAVWVVLNDGQYGMVHHGMQAHQMSTAASGIEPVDFVMLARAVGADGARVTTASELDQALRAALASEGPFVVDVAVDPTVPPPIVTRVESLPCKQTHH